VTREDPRESPKRSPRRRRRVEARGDWQLLQEDMRRNHEVQLAFDFEAEPDVAPASGQTVD
jgi:hypothetical protein